MVRKLMLTLINTSVITINTNYMKIISLGLLTLMLTISCQKKEEVTTSSTTSTPTAVVNKEETVGYIAYNGKRASVTFKQNEKENTINILSTGRTFNLDYQKDTPTGKLYSRNGVDAETKGDSLYITSGKTIIELAKVK